MTCASDAGRSRIPANRTVVPLCVLLLLAGLAIPERSQAQVTLKLREAPSDPATALPVGTEVLTLRRDGRSAQSLADLGLDNREILVEETTDRLEAEPQKAYTRVTREAGETERSGFESRQLCYVLALTPQGRLYESHVGEEPGADLVVSGKLRMGPVSTTHRERMRRAFREAARQGLTAVGLAQPLTLMNGSSPLPPETEVRVWTRDDAKALRLGGRLPSESRKSNATTVGANGQTESEFPRTRYSEEVVYVVAKKPDGTLYESQASTTAGYHPVGQEAIEMAPVPDVHAALKNQFPGSDSSSGSWGGLLWGPGGWLISLGLGLMGALYYRREAQALEDTLKRKRRDMNRLKDGRSQNTAGVVLRGSPDSEDDQDHAPDPSKTAGETAPAGQTAHPASPATDSDRGRTDPRADARAASSTEEGEEVSSPDPRQTETEQGPKTSNSPGDRAEIIGEVFVAWCQTAPVMRGRYYMFERELQKKISEATVTPISSDPRTEEGFRTDRDAGQDAFWCVHLGAAALLLPAPQRDGRFQVLDPAFDVETRSGEPVDTPDCEVVATCRPARLQKEGDIYVLVEVGRLVVEHAGRPSNPSS